MIKASLTAPFFSIFAPPNLLPVVFATRIGGAELPLDGAARQRHLDANAELPIDGAARQCHLDALAVCRVGELGHAQLFRLGLQCITSYFPPLVPY